MNLRNTSNGYAPTLIALHWLMVIVLIGVYACIELRVFYPKGSDPREALKMWHFMLGLSVLALVTVRVVLRLMAGRAPRVEPPLTSWQRISSKAVHLVLYALMLGMPLTGWVILSAAGKPIPFFGLELPPLTGKNGELAGQLKELHETFGVAGYFLIALHAVAALFHHYFVRDNTLLRMLPGRK